MCFAPLRPLLTRLLVFTALAAFAAPGCTDEGERTSCQQASGCSSEDVPLVDRDLWIETREPDVSVGVDMGQDGAGPDGVEVDTRPAPDTVAGDSTNGSDAQLAVLTATQPNEHEVLYGWIVAGQPSQARVTELVGLDPSIAIISLRPVSEDPYDEETLIATLGGRFARYPTDSTKLFDAAFRVGLYELLDTEQQASHLVYLHCASSNRAGAAWALYQAERKGVPAAEAIAMGVAAGLTSLEPVVRQILGV